MPNQNRKFMVQTKCGILEATVLRETLLALAGADRLPLGKVASLHKPRLLRIARDIAERRAANGDTYDIIIMPCDVERHH
jgi:hypothetical protein